MQPSLPVVRVLLVSRAMSDHQPSDNTHCQNCGTELKGPYCHACGQHDFEVHRSFLHLAHELLESFFHFEGKFFRGTYELLFRPGMLTNAFNAGKRASQMPPLRLYIFISLIFFLAPSAVDSSEALVRDDDTESVSKVASEGVKEFQKEYKEVKKKAKKDPVNKVDTGTFLDDLVQHKLGHTEEIKRHFFDYLPKMLMLCVPVFALITRVVFRKSGLNYLQHLVFSLHLHSFFMLFWLFSSGWSQLAGLWSGKLAFWISFAACTYMTFYAYRALRNVFGHERRGTLWRGAFIMFTYSGVIVTGLMLTGFIALLAS